MSEPVKIGSSEWWTATADKVVGMGLDVLKHTLQGVDDTGGKTANQVSQLTSSNKWLPFAIGAVAVGGIVLIMSKR